MGYYLKKNTSAGKPMFNLKASNGEIILTSESYESTAARDNGIRSCQINSHLDERYVDRQSSANEPYFVLKAGNGEVIGTSEMYSSNAAREVGKASCKANGDTTDIR